MHIKPREHPDTLPDIPEHWESSIYVFIIALILLGILLYLIVQHVIPVISANIFDFLKQIYDVAGGQI
jgi:hypothetical protein